MITILALLALDVPVSGTSPVAADVAGCRLVVGSTLDKSRPYDLIYVGYKKVVGDPLSTSRIALVSLHDDKVLSRSVATKVKFLMNPPIVGGPLYSTSVAPDFEVLVQVVSGRFDRIQINRGSDAFLCERIENGSADHTHFMTLASGK